MLCCVVGYELRRLLLENVTLILNGANAQYSVLMENMTNYQGGVFMFVM